MRTLLAASLLALCALPTLAAGHYCVLRTPAGTPGYPPLLIERVDFEDSAEAAACRMIENHQIKPPEGRCPSPGAARLARCLAVPTDPVVDPTRQGLGGVEGAAGPRKAYRCRMGVTGATGGMRNWPYVAVEASSWAEIDQQRQASGARNAVARGSCLPAAVYEDLARGP